LTVLWALGADNDEVVEVWGRKFYQCRLHSVCYQ